VATTEGQGRFGAPAALEHVSDLAPDVGDTVSVFLRVPKASGVKQALLRTFIDGEQALTETTLDRENEHEVWLRGQFRVENPVVGYRWLLDGVPDGYQWLNGEGTYAHDVTDAADFRSRPTPPRRRGRLMPCCTRSSRTGSPSLWTAPLLTGRSRSVGRPGDRPGAGDAVPVLRR
jgi:hypothetical protein